jgi:HSP20 family protein
MSAPTPHDGQDLSHLFEWLEAPDALLPPSAGHTIRTEEGVENGRYLVRAELPGIDPEKDAEVTVSKGILTIRAGWREETGGSRSRKFRYGSLTRHVTLPASADETAVEASYDGGILEVSVALKANDETGHHGRRIPVRPVQRTEPA